MIEENKVAKSTVRIRDTKSRKYQLTFNNPEAHGISHGVINEVLNSKSNILYACFADEIGEEGTYHTHLYMHFRTPVRFSMVKKLFGDAEPHIESCNGSAEDNRNYVAKEGKWAEDRKKETCVEGTFEEYGEMPKEVGQGYRSDIAEIYSLIRDGKSNSEIMEQNPASAAHISLMDKIRHDSLMDQFRDTFRTLDITYIWGDTGTGKTRGVMESNGYMDVFRVTNYAHPFDEYLCQPVMCFDEFHSSLGIGEMLQYLDGYPVCLPARYTSRVACYEKVYIISNIPLTEQYPEVQVKKKETWKAFLRRINHVVEYRKDEKIIDHGDALSYVFAPKEFTPVRQQDIPFA